MQIRQWRVVATACVLTALTVSITAAGARFWQVSTQADFLKGDVQNLSVDQYGRLTLGPALTAVGESTTPFLWTLVPAADGGVYAGSGNDGQVFHFAPDGTRTVFFDAAELEVHALAPAPGGGLFVGTSPAGKIYRVDAKGQSTVYLDPEDKYIWSLAVDAAGVLYAATGEKGLIYKITAEGKGDVFYRTKATHAITLLFDKNGDLLAGTESPGKVFRIKKDGTGFVLLDPGIDEISALRLDAAGTVYASALTGRAAGSSRPSPADRDTSDTSTSAVPSVSTEITSVTIVDVSPIGTGSSTPSREDRRGSTRGAVYRILPDGVSDVVWESSDDVPYDLLPEANGSLVVATGAKGKLYRLTGDPVRVALIASADAQQVTSLLNDVKGNVWLASANPGKLFRLSGSQATRGTFTSEVRDAETVATWGALSWRAANPPVYSGQAVHPLGQHRSARRHMEPVVRTVFARRWRADYESQSPLPAVEGRSDGHRHGVTDRDVRHCSLSAAQPAAAGDLNHDPSSRRRVPEALLDRRSGDRRLRRVTVRSQAIRGRIVGDPGCNRNADDREARVSEGAADDHLEGRRRQRR